jgi:hypothetical protein
LSQQIGIKAWVFCRKPSAKFKVKNFNGQNSFSLWRMKMHALLGQQGLAKILENEEPSTTSKKMHLKKKSTMQFCCLFLMEF